MNVRLGTWNQLAPDPWPTAAFAFVVLGWVVFGSIFLFRKKPPKAPEKKKEGVSWAGIVLQGLSIGMCWALQRTHFTPIVAMPKVAEAIVAMLTMALSGASIWLSLEAVRTLGKQWSYVARLAEGHKLIVSGPYRFVRHPIYTAMFGKLLATALAMSHWIVLAPAILLFAFGTAIRVRSEERLLRSGFGDDFEAYVRYVPAILPRLW